MSLCMCGTDNFRVLSKITRTRRTQQNRAHDFASLGLGHIAEAEWPAFERGICTALTKEAPLLVEQLQRSLVVEESASSSNDGSDGLIFGPAVEEALGEFVRGYATRWGIWESAKTVAR